MGIWSWDIIGCDANLELAMDLLTEAGIGPENYATRRKTFMVLVCEHPLQDGRTGMWLGRHNPEEYVEFFSCLDASATQHKALDGALQGMIKLANSVQTVFEVGKDGGCPVGHAFQVLGLILMQAGAMPAAIADVLLSMPLCAASNPGAHNEREEHENRFKDAIREYKDARVERHEAFLYTRVDPSSVPGEEGPPHVSVRVEPFPVFRGVAIKYRPRSWADQMYHVDEGDVPATITRVPFKCRSLLTGRATMQTVEQGDPMMETLAAQGKLERAKRPSAYTREPEEYMVDKAIMSKRVRLVGLVKRPDCNGLLGTVMAYNDSTDRYAVDVDGIGRMALKKANLDVCDA